MKTNSLDCCQPDGLEKIKEWLKDLGIECSPGKGYDNTLFDNHFNRWITFEINEIRYHICWFINQCELIIGDERYGARIPFKYIYEDVAYPLVGGNRSIGFSFLKNKVESMFDREFPYEVLRIPIKK